MSKEQVLNLLLDRVEEMGMELGTEGIKLLEQYYPIVRRQVLTSNIIYLVIAVLVSFVLAGIYYYIYKERQEHGYLGEFEAGLAVVTTIFAALTIFIASSIIVKLLNIDFYTIEVIIDKISSVT